MIPFEPWIAFLLGLLVGSFLNVCIHRLPQELAVWNPARSFCPRCRQTLAWYDNVPVLSYLLLRGKCRHCGAPISWRYPAVELFTAILFAFIAALGLPPVYTAKFVVFAAIMVVLIVSDFEERFLPDAFTLGGAVVGVVFAYYAPVKLGALAFILQGTYGPQLASAIEAVFAAVALSGILWVLGEIYYRIRGKEGLGLGDVKMLATLGAFLGLQGAMLSLMAASVAGTLLGVGYMMVARKDFATYELPLGSFLGIAGLLVGYMLLGSLVPGQ
ncbi:MAG: prepilin peptidase [Bryobacterales bacterium]|nr:prepilin peptidase [Bryobacterales bacterium]